MMGIGFPELMIILVIIMIIFGAGKLPEIGSAFGNSIKNFKKSMKEAEEIQESANIESAEDYVFKLKNSTKRVNGNFTLLWHNSNLCLSKYRELYKRLI